MTPSIDLSPLFEPLGIGPVTAKNRFYQVPHCTGLGHAHPQAEAALREVKAEGGWAVVCSQEVEIHPSSEISPYLEGRLWDDSDIPVHRLMTDAVHRHDALAGIELVHNGMHAANLYSRVPPMGPSHRPVDLIHPVQARAMNRRDIREFRRWYVDAARRARHAGYDIIYVYAGHNMATLMHFLLARYNDRCDDYGGSLRNRLRLLEETLTDVRDAVGGDCAVALRLAVDELLGDGGLRAEDEGREIVTRLADVPDLWDVNISGWANDSATSRFEPDEGYQERYTAFVKSLVRVPVVGVGRFTSASAMLSQLSRGVLDFIGAARPSIADPFLPQKLQRGAIDEVRECIGCNICVSSDNVVAPIRCTQNPTMGEEWKRGWHPERAPMVATAQRALVIGAGPAGLECATQLSRQGVDVWLAEAETRLGGRLQYESAMPGLAAYRRVLSWREQQLRRSKHVDVLLDNRLVADDIAGIDADHVIVATGARWCADARGRQHPQGLDLGAVPGLAVMTPDALWQGKTPEGRIVVYDDDHYYLGGVIAEWLADRGYAVTLLTPAATVSCWTEHTLEQHRIQARLLHRGVTLVLQRELQVLRTNGEPPTLGSACLYTGQVAALACDTLIPVTARLPDSAFASLSETGDARIQFVGDCLAPSTVAAAVYAGHLAARSVTGDESGKLFRRESPVLP